jgi:integrase/recombinase XerC
MSNVSVNRKVASLKAIYRFLLKTKQIQLNPLLKHKALKTAKVLQIPFSEKEVAEVLGEIQSPVGFEEVRNKLIIDLFYTTGIRRTELIHLKISDIDAKVFNKGAWERNKENPSSFAYYVEQLCI